MSLAENFPCKVSPRSRLFPEPLATISLAHAARDTTPLTVPFIWTQELINYCVERDEREKKNIGTIRHLGASNNQETKLCTMPSCRYFALRDACDRNFWTDNGDSAQGFWRPSSVSAKRILLGQSESPSTQLSKRESFRRAECSDAA